MEQKRGAEAIVTLREDVVRKTRVPKGYRHPRIDEQLITQRTRTEARILERLEDVAGVPRLSGIEGDDTLLIEYIDASEYAGEEIAGELAELLFALHERGVAHADVAPKNVLVGERCYLIDFGLARITDRIEDRAYDLSMTRETFSAHPGFSDALIAAYRELLDDPRAFDERVERIEERGRNKKRT